MVITLKSGSRGLLIKELQYALNAKLRPCPNLVADGVFGPNTDRAVMVFQTDNWLVVDGHVGVCTQNALYGNDTYTPVLHSISFILQPTYTTYWAANTAMMTNSTVSAVKAKTLQDMWSERSGLFNSSETNDAMTSGN